MVMALHGIAPLTGITTVLFTVTRRIGASTRTTAQAFTAITMVATTVILTMATLIMEAVMLAQDET